MNSQSTTGPLSAANPWLVYVAENGKAKRVPVELGKRLPGKVEIVSGLTPKMKIITAGQMRLRDGSPIAVKDKPVQTSQL